MLQNTSIWCLYSDIFFMLIIRTSFMSHVMCNWQYICNLRPSNWINSHFTKVPTHPLSNRLLKVVQITNLYCEKILVQKSEKRSQVYSWIMKALHDHEGMTKGHDWPDWNIINHHFLKFFWSFLVGESFKKHETRGTNIGQNQKPN